MAKFLRILLLLLNAICAVLLVLSTLTAWMEPSRFRLPSLLSYACPYLFVVNGLWVIFWLCLVRKTFLLSAAAIVLRMSFIPLYVQVGGVSEWTANDQPALRVMTFNVHGFRGTDGELPADSGAARFVALLHQEQPDVVSLEEFARPPHYALLDSLQRMGYAYHHGYRERLGGVVLFSRFPLTPVEAGGRGEVCTDVAWQGDTVRFISVHLNSYRLTADESHDLSRLNYRETHVRSIFHKMLETIDQHEREWREELYPLLTASPHPVLVAGDFNDTPASYIYQQLSQHLRDTYVEQGRGFSNTYHASKPPFRIDYVFCDSTFTVEAYRCVASDISDHYPVMAVLGPRE